MLFKFYFLFGPQTMDDGKGLQGLVDVLFIQHLPQDALHY